MNDTILEIYRSIANRLILQAAHGLKGQAKSATEDFERFRRSIVDPAWNQMPGDVKAMGRDQLRWDDVMADLVQELFVTRPDGVLVMRGDAPERLDGLVERVVSSPAALAPVKPPIRPAVPSMEIAPPTPAPKAAAPLLAQPVASAPVITLPPPPTMAWPVPAAKPVGDASPARPLKPSMTAVGIDLGTTYSVIAYLDNTGRPTSITNSAGDLTTPSVVLFDDEGPIVGKQAVAGGPIEPDRVAFCVKRDMGSREYRKPVNGVRLPPEVISSVVLKTLLNDARRRLGPDITKAVITVPAYFDELRRRATMDAGRLAGIDVLDIINEPTAAALAFGYQTGFLDPTGNAATEEPINVLVYDLGGGTFDVTVVEIHGSSFKALATDGDVALGGKDFDETIVNFAAEKFHETYGIDPRTNLACFLEMWNGAEAVKKTLSERSKATLYVNLDGQKLKVDITRAEFEEMSAPLVSRTRTTTEIVLRQAGLAWKQIGRVLLVGGSSRMPMISDMLRELSGKEPDRSISPDEAVAHGAALYANLLVKKLGPHAEKPEFSITNINSHSLGIVGIDPQTNRKRNQILIPKNTALPHTVTKVFRTQKPNQTAVMIRVVEGESERPEACIQVGACRIENLPANLPQGAPVQVSYAYHDNGQLEVTGQVPGADAIRTVFQRENKLESDQMSMWSKYLETIRE